MMRNFSIRELMKSMIPISRFNRGEASKIFEEVKKTGVKIVLKNNAPVGVIVDPKRYEAMIEMLEDYAAFFEAEKRIKAEQGETPLSHEQVLQSLGIDEAELDDAEVEIE